MPASASRIADETEIASFVAELARAIVQGATPGKPLALVGVRSRGVPLAERIAAEIRKSSDLHPPVGAVDITLYRDDIGRNRSWPVLKGTEIPFAVEDAEIVLVDDVLYTGRTIRAAIDCVCDLGRPSAIRLAVLVDRGGRELPIQADYRGWTYDAGPGRRVGVRLRPFDPADEVVLTVSEGNAP